MIVEFIAAVLLGVSQPTSPEGLPPPKRCSVGRVTRRLSTYNPGWAFYYQSIAPTELESENFLIDNTGIIF